MNYSARPAPDWPSGPRASSAGQLADAGRRLGSKRAEAFRKGRECRAIELGFVDLVSYYRRRYGEEYRRLDELAAELGCAQSAVRGDAPSSSVAARRAAP